MRLTRLRWMCAFALLLFASSAWSLDAPVRQPLRFAKGATSATVAGTLRGDRTIDYVVEARAGQTMRVALRTRHTSTYFNVLPPGSAEEAIHVGSIDGNRWEGRLTRDGAYTVRVYMMRSAARRNERAPYTLTVAIAAAAKPAPLGTAPAHDARVSGTGYHATGQVPCSLGRAAPRSAGCDFGVIRGTSGNADLHLTLPGGAKRTLYFRGAQVTADGGAAVTARHAADEWIVDVDGREHYWIADVAILGD